MLTTDAADALTPDVQRANLQPLREHRAFITVFILSAIISAVALTYVYTERYRAETTIFFKSSDVARLASHSTMALGSPLPTLPYKVVTQTITGLVDSDQLLRQVVLDLHLDAAQPRDYSGPWYVSYYKRLKDQLSDYASDAWKILRFGRIIEEDPVNKAIGDLRKEIKVKNDDSYVYTLQVTAKTPKLAVATADDIAAVLIDLVHRNEQRPASEEIGKLGSMRDAKLREVESLQERLRDVLGSLGIASIKEEIDRMTALSAHFQQERADATADLRQSEARLGRLGDKLRLPAPQLAVADGAANAAALRGASRLTADDYAKLTTEKHTAEITTSAFRAKLDAIERSLVALTQRLQQLGKTQAEYEVVSAQLASAKRDYAALDDAYEERLIQTTSGQSELRIQAQATIPQLPVSPIKIYHTAAAGLLAVLLAMGLAFVLDYFQIRVFLPSADRRRRRRPDAPPPPVAAPVPEAKPAAVRVDAD